MNDYQRTWQREAYRTKAHIERILRSDNPMVPWNEPEQDAYNLKSGELAQRAVCEVGFTVDSHDPPTRLPWFTKLPRRRIV